MNKAKRLLKSELAKREIGYEDLANRLTERGWRETMASVANKISRGTFNAEFFVESLQAIGCKTLHLDIGDELGQWMALAA